MVDLVHSNIGMYALMKHHHDQNNEHVYHLQRFSCAIFESQFSGFLAFQRLINLINFPCNSTLSMTVLIEQTAQFGRRLLDSSRTQSAKCSFLCLYLKLLMSSSVLSLFFCKSYSCSLLLFSSPTSSVCTFSSCTFSSSIFSSAHFSYSPSACPLPSPPHSAQLSLEQQAKLFSEFYTIRIDAPIYLKNGNSKYHTSQKQGLLTLS